MVKTCGSAVTRLADRRLIPREVRPVVDEDASLEACADADERDEVRCVHGAPPVLGELDALVVDPRLPDRHRAGRGAHLRAPVAAVADHQPVTVLVAFIER